MLFRLGVTTLLAASLAAFPNDKAEAGDAAGAAIGGLIGGFLGAAAANSQKQKQQAAPQQRTTVIYREVKPKAAPKPRPTVSAADRAANAEVQNALNFFGWHVGRSDGVLGRNSRSGISQYQAFMGFAPTGYLNTYERSLLVNSYQRSLGNPMLVNTLVAQEKMGMQGVLKAYQRADSGAGPLVIPATVAIAPPPPPQPAPPVVEAAAATEVPEVETEEGLGGSSLMAALTAKKGRTAKSMASHCHRLSLMDGVDAMAASDAASSELLISAQFCRARAFSIEYGNQLLAPLGVPMETVEAECDAASEAFRPFANAVSIKPMDKVGGEVIAFVGDQGVDPDGLADLARICLSTGYRTDNADMALGSATVLAALGEPIYGEMVGYHLVRGFGTRPRVDLALGWFKAAFDALDRGSEPAIMPTDTARYDGLRSAVAILGNPGEAAIIVEQPREQSVGLSGMPSFR